MTRRIRSRLAVLNLATLDGTALLQNHAFADAAYFAVRFSGDPAEAVEGAFTLQGGPWALATPATPPYLHDINTALVGMHGFFASVGLALSTVIPASGELTGAIFVAPSFPFVQLEWTDTGSGDVTLRVDVEGRG